MKTKKPLMIASVLTTALLAGCLNLTPPASLTESRGLVLTEKSSGSVQVNQPRLQMNHGILELAGSVSKQSGVSSTAFSHLDILFLDTSGNIILTKLLRFTPQSVGHSRHARQLGSYSLKLDQLPEGTVRIEVRAHDGDIEAAHPLS